MKVTYKDVKPPILNFKQAIEAKAFHTMPPFLGDKNKGDVAGACKTLILFENL